MKNCIGIIYSNGPDDSYEALSKSRPDYMFPFGGRYRIIDFALSNMSNSNLSHVMLYAGKNIRSTLDHIGDGKNWELNRRNNGLMINPPSYDSLSGEKCEVQTYFDSLPFYEYTKADHIYLQNPMFICKNNIRQAYDVFVDDDYDAMLFYSRMADPEGRYINMQKLILDASGNFVNVGLHLGTQETVDLFLGRAFVKKQVFIDVLKDAVERGNAKTLIQALLNNKNRLKIGVYAVEDYVSIIRDIRSFYQANMDLLHPEVYNELFYQGGMVYTKSKDEPSTLYKAGSLVRNSLIANGCIIEGQVENSIIFRGVRIHKGAIIRNCILIQKTTVEEGAVLVNTISDKYAHIESGLSLVGSAMKPYVIGKNEVVRQ